jgi:hypothetical protein
VKGLWSGGRGAGVVVFGCDMRSRKRMSTYDDGISLKQRTLGARGACAPFEVVSGEGDGSGGSGGRSRKVWERKGWDGNGKWLRSGIQGNE